MSTIQANAILDASGGNTVTVNGVTPNSDVVKGRNLIINGAMNVAQRGTSTTGVSSGGYYSADRFRIANNGTPDELVVTVEQSTDAPTGFANSFKYTVTTAETSLDVDERVRIQQRVEGQNLQHLKYGTSDAQYITLSFYVKSNVTGTYGIHLNNRNSSRNICASYTISAADTWEKKTISFAGDTTGSFNNDSGRSLDVCWVLAAGTNYTSGTFATSWEADTDANNAPSGQVNLIDTVSNYFSITGVKLEVGSVATEYDHRSFAEELQLCQRYYQILANNLSDTVGASSKWSASNNFIFVDLPVEMRTQPTLDTNLSTVTAAMRLSSMGYNGTGNDLTLDGDSSPRRLRLNTTIDNGSITNGAGGWLRINNGTIYVNIDAEL